MTGGPIIRLFSFRAARPAFDETLRAVLVPDLRRQPGLVEAYVGRQGPGDQGPRLVASVWTDRVAMSDAVGDGLGTFHPELLSDTTEHLLEILRVRVDRRFGPPDSASILRILRGQVRGGEMDEYVDDVRHGADLDSVSDHGPVALFLGQGEGGAQGEPGRFATVSTWRDWHDIELATGGDIHRPRATRHPERLTDWDVQHYELIRGV